jgi:hypothetical protein
VLLQPTTATMSSANTNGLQILISSVRIDLPRPVMGTVQWPGLMLQKY